MEAEETVAGASQGAGGAETEIVAVDYPPTGCDLAPAWSDCDDDEFDGSWREALSGAAVPLFVAAVVAFVAVAILGVWALLAWRSDTQPVAPPTPVVIPMTALPHMPPPPPPSTREVIVPGKDRDSQFLAELSRIPVIVYQPDLSINAAHWICGERAGGMAQDDAVAALSKVEPRLKGDAPAGFVRASERAYCPQYEGN